MFNFFTKKNIQQASLHFPSHPMWNSSNYYNFAHKGYQKNVIAFRSINTIATCASSIKFLLYRITAKGKVKEKRHPLIKLLNHPNSRTSQAEFIESLVAYRLISGNAYILKLGQNTPSELYTLRPDRISVIKGEYSTPLGYKYQVNNKSTQFLVNKYTGMSSILHLKTFNPLDDWYGLSSLEAASYSIDQHNQAGAWNQAMLQNGARPSGALVVTTNKDGSGGTLDFKQYERLKTQIDEIYTGSANAGKPLLLEGGLDWKEMSLSPRDMDFINCKHSSARDISLAFGVPSQLLGIPGDNTYSNLVEARIALWEQTVLPIINNIIDNLNRWLVPDFGDNLELQYDKEAIDIMVLKREKVWNFLAKANFMTVNEKREAIGLSPIKGGDVLAS